jgi:xylono-1,5-lactonase
MIRLRHSNFPIGGEPVLADILTRHIGRYTHTIKFSIVLEHFMPEVRLIWAIEARLGEGPIWLQSAGSLLFVDIESGKLHGFEEETEASSTIHVGGAPSFVVPASDGSLLIGSVNQILRLDGDSAPTIVLEFEEPLHNRTNDATVDSLGRLWFGTMDDRELQPTGALYCWDGTTLHHMGCNAVVTNGPAISDDAQMLYFVDTTNRTIWRYPVLSGPALGTGEVFLQLNEGDGYPDGIVLDSEGCLWVAFWDGWCVRRYAPDATLLLSVPLPCSRVTKIAFGGPELRTIYVTTARTGLSQANIETQPLAGGLFCFDAPVSGRSQQRVTFIEQEPSFDRPATDGQASFC